MKIHILNLAVTTFVSLSSTTAFISTVQKTNSVKLFSIQPRPANDIVSKNQKIISSPQEKEINTNFISSTTTTTTSSSLVTAIASTVTFLTLTAPSSANAIDSTLYSAIVAYGHYLSLLIITTCVCIERFTIKPNMSLQEESLIAKADITLGIVGTTLLGTGYIRATDLACGKGWDFYSHEPIFWLKMIGVAVFGAASFFPTTKIIQRSIAQRNGEFEPMTEKLASRLISILNAELLAIFSIPLTATLMSRGVLYNTDIPWQAEFGLVLAVLFGLGGKYIKEALDWTEDEEVVTAIE